MEETVVLIKPDGVRRGLIGEIITRFEKIGLKIKAAKLIWVDKTQVGKHYKDDSEYHKTVGIKALENYKKYGFDPKEDLGTTNPIKIGRLVRKRNMEFLSSGPLFAMLIEGPEAIGIVRKIVGSTFPSEALPGTIRGDYSYDSAILCSTEKRAANNLIHASGNKDEAIFEKKLWFKKGEIYSY